MIKITKIILLTLSITVSAAWADQEIAPGELDQLTLDDLRTFTDVFNQIRNNFVEETNDRDLLDAAIRGMLAELDPHSSYMKTEEFKRLDDDSRGRYSGVGVELSLREGQINVDFVIPGGPADSASIVVGDVITAINGSDLRDKDQRLAVGALRGEVGSEVDVTVRHQNGEVSTRTLTRDFVKVDSVFSRPVDEDYGYFQITHFTRKSAEELAEQIEYMQQNRATPLKGAVLDLRGNPGGVLRPAVEIADGFLEQGLIVETRGRSEPQASHTAQPGSWLPGVPMVVLVDRRSASASEVLAGALQDHERALIIGERTFGKGSVQSVLNLRNGAGMRLTTSRYYTPSGRSIQASGIQPDVEVTSVRAVETADTHRREADLERHLDGEPGDNKPLSESQVSATDDYMMYQALLLLKGASALAPDRH